MARAAGQLRRAPDPERKVEWDASGGERSTHRSANVEAATTSQPPATHDPRGELGRERPDRFAHLPQLCRRRGDEVDVLDRHVVERLRRDVGACVHHYSEAAQDESFAPGESLALVAEPDNRYDADAIDGQGHVNRRSN